VGEKGTQPKGKNDKSSVTAREKKGGDERQKPNTTGNYRGGKGEGKEAAT